MEPLKKTKKQLFSSAIKLGPALGDWTKIGFDDSERDFFHVDQVGESNFDSLSKEHLKETHLIHHAFAYKIAKHLSKDLDMKIELHTVMVTQMVYADFINSINDNIFQADLGVGSSGFISMIFGSNLASMMMNRLIGGEGQDTSKSTFNQLEMSLLSEQLQHVVPYLKSVWGDSLDISESALSLYSGEYKCDNRISYRETYIVFTVYLYFGDGELLRLMVAYPNQIVRQLLEARDKTVRKIVPEIQFKKQTVDSIHYDVSAELGTIDLPMSTLRNLKQGDIIPLNKSLYSLISLRIGEQVKLLAQPCIYKGKLGCQIVLKEGHEVPIQLVAPNDMGDDLVKDGGVPIEKIVDRSTLTHSLVDSNFKQPDVSEATLSEYLSEEFNHEKNTTTDSNSGLDSDSQNQKDFGNMSEVTIDEMSADVQSDESDIFEPDTEAAADVNAEEVELTSDERVEPIDETMLGETLLDSTDLLDSAEKIVPDDSSSDSQIEMDISEHALGSADISDPAQDMVSDLSLSDSEVEKVPDEVSIDNPDEIDSVEDIVHDDSLSNSEAEMVTDDTPLESDSASDSAHDVVSDALMSDNDAEIVEDQAALDNATLSNLAQDIEPDDLTFDSDDPSESAEDTLQPEDTASTTDEAPESDNSLETTDEDHSLETILDDEFDWDSLDDDDTDETL